MTNQRYKKIQYIIRRLQHHMQICDELHDEETTQRQNFGQHMGDESLICWKNENSLMQSITHIQEAVENLKKIKP